MSAYNHSEEYDLLIETNRTTQQGAIRAGYTREQAQRMFDRLYACKAAQALKYKNGKNARVEIDWLFEDGARVQEGKFATTLVMPDQSSIDFRRKAERDYIRVVANTGPLARNF